MDRTLTSPGQDQNLNFESPVIAPFPVNLLGSVRCLMSMPLPKNVN